MKVILKDKVVNNTVYQFVSFDLGVEIFLKKREHQKRVHWNTRLRLLCTLCIGVSRKFHLHFTLMFYLRYYKMVQSLYKNWLLVSKITRGIWKNLDKQAVDSPKSWNLLGYFCPKYTCLQLKQYTHRIYLTFFQLLVWKSTLLLFLKS